MQELQEHTTSRRRRRWVPSRQDLDRPPFWTRYLRTTKAARYIGLSPGTLRNLRASGDGPSFSKIRNMVIYAVEDLDAWIAKHRIEQP